MSEHNCDHHTHTTLAELQDCMAEQRSKFQTQVLTVLIILLCAIGMWATR